MSPCARSALGNVCSPTDRLALGLGPFALSDRGRVGGPLAVGNVRQSRRVLPAGVALADAPAASGGWSMPAP